MSPLVTRLLKSSSPRLHSVSCWPDCPQPARNAPSLSTASCLRVVRLRTPALSLLFSGLSGQWLFAGQCLSVLFRPGHLCCFVTLKHQVCEICISSSSVIVGNPHPHPHPATPSPGQELTSGGLPGLLPCYLGLPVTSSEYPMPLHLLCRLWPYYLSPSS